MDPAGINETIKLVQSVIKLGKRATSLQYEEALQAAREVILELREQNVILKEQDGELKQLLKNKDEFTLDKGVYWQKTDEIKDQPFCPVCYSKGNLIPLQKHWDGRGKAQTRWVCPENGCKAFYNPWNYKEPDPLPPQFQDLGFGI